MEFEKNQNKILDNSSRTKQVDNVKHSGDFHTGYSIKTPQQGFLRRFIPGPLSLSYALDIECLITLVKVWLFIMCENEISGNLRPVCATELQPKKDTNFLKHCFYPNYMYKSGLSTAIKQQSFVSLTTIQRLEIKDVISMKTSGKCDNILDLCAAAQHQETERCYVTSERHEYLGAEMWNADVHMLLSCSVYRALGVCHIVSLMIIQV